MAPTTMAERSPGGLSYISDVQHTKGKRQLSPDKPVRASHLNNSSTHSTCHGSESLADSYTLETNIARLLLLCVVGICGYHRHSIQVNIDSPWDYLRMQPFFYSAYFESFYVTVVYAVVLGIHPVAAHYISSFNKFKVRSDVTYVHHKPGEVLKEAVVYTVPLLAADSIIQKKYAGVPAEEWAERSKQWIQTTRALPVDAPGFFEMCFHVVGAVIVFDALFFLLHFTLHKNAFLYRYVHSVHHRHGALHAHVTNQLSIFERVAIVAAANVSLKLWSAHPLTRLVFVFVFLWLLVDNHTGYDFPWSPHRIAPPGLMGGPAKHHAHHTNGNRHFQPFFTYLDAFVESWLPRDTSLDKKLE